MTDTAKPAAASLPAEGTSAETVGGQEFRDAIARNPSGVHVVTTAGDAGRSGFTATAFASVSDAPPTVLVCLNRGSSQNELMKKNACFAVNLLPKQDASLADVFAGRTGLHLEARFDHGAWTRLVTGAPVLAEAVMALDCRLSGYQEVGSHTVFFGLVVATRRATTGDDAGVLIYHDRHYAAV